MEKDNFKTDVIFRVDTSKNWKGTVYALFPHDAERSGFVTTYQHIGQHSSADYHHCIATSRLATESEYKELKSELEQLGYDLNVVKKQNRTKYLRTYYLN